MPDAVTLDPTTRAPSSPLAALIRSAFIVPVSIKAAGVLAPLGIPVDATMLAGMIVGALAAGGKVARNKWAWAKWLPF